MIHNILFTDEAHFTCDGVNSTRNSHLWDHDNPHGTVKSNYQHRFSMNLICGVIGEQLTGLYIFPQHLTGDIYANFLKMNCQHSQRMFLYKHDNRCYYQHDGVPSHFSHVIRQYLNHKFPNWWIGHDGAQNWPPWSADLNPLDYYHVWGYTKAMVYVHKVNTREELLHRILSSARDINNTAVFHKVISALVTWVRKCSQADGGYFEQFAWVLNSESVTVHVTTYLNKRTMLLFPF